eukprot:NODE_2501_length_1565_cov_47.631068_g2154_i0.p1 GENE.NODE_2501_length_1565_cov_47.631068_g2154_i0~~NODE_2501_length_1565_cov_47.631068_g2154_i0.p1  ORF type:complete len:302 (-),score=68.53 NODE_2501_length_1565_cov_47.631068_g2154_i0:56-961(-)
MGHEFVGQIEEVGANIKKFTVGQVVFSPFTTCCGCCDLCDKRLFCRCDKGQLFGYRNNGKGLHGAQSEYVRVPLADSTLVALPPKIHPEIALLLGDILSTGYFVAKNADLRKDSKCVVVGCGPVGMLATASCVKLGVKPENILVVDPAEDRLLKIKTDLSVCTSTPDNALSIINQKTNGLGVDAVIEAVGNTKAHQLALQLVRPGGVISVCGVHTSNDFGFTPADLYNKNITYRVGRCNARLYMEELIPSIEDFKFPLGQLISHRLPISEAANGYKMFSSRTPGCTKVVLQMSPFPQQHKL